MVSAEEEQELLELILKYPYADRDRAKYAALLERRGDPRGELITIQLQLAEARSRQMLPPPGLREREKELLARYGNEWSREVAPLVDGLEFFRGFVDHVTLDARGFLERAEAIYRVAPVIYLTLTGVRDVYRELFASPRLARIRALELEQNGLGDDALEALAASPHLGKLAWLDLSRNDITARGVEALAASKHLPALAYVKLSGNPSGDPADTPVAIDVDRPNLEVLEWGSSPLAVDLEQKYGTIRWLHWRPTSDFFRFPNMDGV